MRTIGLGALLLAGCSAAQVLVDFQVAAPPVVPQGAKQCTIEILQHSFAQYGVSAIANYTPPTDCGTPGSWAAITLNFTVTSNGTQYDRLGIFTFQNVEIWRTSTPEPTLHGIEWTYEKDVTRYMPLFEEPGLFIIQLDNIVQPGLTGIYTSVLHATFYESSWLHPPAPKANAIIPISTMSNTTGNDASVPPGFSFEPNIGGPDQGPFREVRLLVDGQVAGVAFPYPVLFTGGIIPTAWRPITSYGALDLPTYFIDVTPFVPVLTDGKAHNFTIDVASAEADKGVLGNWYVSGNLQVFTDPSPKRTTGKITSYNVEPYAESSIVGAVGSNGDVNVTVSATRKVSISSQFVSGSGKITFVEWTQNLAYTNTQNYLQNNFVQNVYQYTSGSMLSLHNGLPAVQDKFNYPFILNYTTLSSDGNSFHCVIDHSYNRDLLPAPFTLGSSIQEHQIAGGYFITSPNGNTGNGTSNNTLNYIDGHLNTYSRQVDAAYNNITLDVVHGSLAPQHKPWTWPQLFPVPNFTKPRMSSLKLSKTH
ncbi:unnamed protein product [Mycena citricolor]|uniref:Peptide N-acetyl-beta-D-glucosaminyl asparaginase amidase A N-terminal domain-containing protein n=1 Tax=Mycena citricolor TaxID=2018698 RepID=A0AAD2HL22_9AGAR|nr:unnamed protein product [Mycena citricolor]